MSQQIDSMMINNQSLSGGGGAQSVQASMNDLDQNMSGNAGAAQANNSSAGIVDPSQVMGA